MVKLQRIIFLIAATIFVCGWAVCSKTTLLLLITLSHEGTKTLLPEQKPLALMCIGCSVIAPSVFVLLRSIWKTCHKTSTLPRKTTAALVLLFELGVSVGVAGLIIAVMPHLDIVTNITILNTVAVLSVLLQMLTQCIAKKSNIILVPSIMAFIKVFAGCSLLLVLSIMKNPNDVNMACWLGLAVSGSILVSFKWWEIHLKLICESSSFLFLQNFLKDMTRSQNFLHIMSSIIRIVVTTCVLGACVPLNKTNWDTVSSIQDHEKRLLLIITGIQLISSALCHQFASAACKIQTTQRSFVPVLYVASLAVMALLIVPVIVFYKYIIDTTESFSLTSYCNLLMDEKNLRGSGNMFLQLVLDVTKTLCYLDMSNIGLMTGVAVSWWIGLGLATIYIWYSKKHCMPMTPNQFIKSLHDGVFIEQSLLKTQFGIQTENNTIECFSKFVVIQTFKENTTTAMVYLCTTMWHETEDEMRDNVISMFRLDQYRPKTEPKFKDFTFEAHIYFDDAFEHVDGIQSRQLNKCAKNLVKIISEVYGSFINTDDTFLGNKEVWKLLKTPYGGRLVVTLPHGNDFMVHFKDSELIRNKKRWTQVMYLYYLLDWNLMTNNNRNLQEGFIENNIAEEIQKMKKNTYLLAMDGDTYLQPTDLKILLKHLQSNPRVGTVSGRIHPIGTGPVVWFQKFEYAVNNWLQKTTEHAFGSLLCTPGSCSLFRAEALMDDDVLEKFSTESTKPNHYLQYDQGEDRWLTSLLLRRGWTVEYIAASNSYSTVPQTLKELFNQRRRWVPTTLANTVDLLIFNYNISSRKSPMSRLFIFYQVFAFFVYVLSPATTSFCIAVSLSFLLDIHFAVALLVVVIPSVIYVGLCFKLKEDSQITMAAVFSILYAVLMFVLIMTPFGSMVKGQTILTPSSVFLGPTFIHFFITAVMHPQELSKMLYAWFYILFLPSFDTLLFTYTVVNMNCIHWGTRETNSDDGTLNPTAPQLTKAQKCWTTELQSLCGDIQLQEESISKEEEHYWKALQERLLKPFQFDRETIEKNQNDLRGFRNKISFWFFFGNALWLLLLFFINIFKLLPCLINIDVNVEETGRIFRVEFVGLTFFLGPAMVVLLQFIGMLYYRVYAIFNYITSLNTEPEPLTWKKKYS